MASKTELDFIVGALIGSAVGVMAALILTPISGKAMRSKIANEFDFSSNGHKGYAVARRKNTHAVEAKIKNASSKRTKTKHHK